MDSERGHGIIRAAGLGALMTTLALGGARPAETAGEALATSPLRQTVAALPLSFEPNVGQTEVPASFLARAGGLSLYLTPGASVVALHGGGPGAAALRMDLVGADPEAAIEGVGELRGKANYLRGNDPARWRTGVATYAGVRVKQAWPGIDVLHHGNGRQLEHDFVVAPGALPSTIRVALSGAGSLSVDAAGDLVIATAAGDLVERAPVLYQDDGCRRRAVAGGFVLLSDREVGFRVGPYDRERELVIDPVLVYSTYLGGSGNEPLSGAIAADATGSAYVAGRTDSFDFPVTPGAFDMSENGGFDIYIAKLSPAGDSLVYSTYIGGTAGEAPHGIAIDGAGNAYVTGSTDSTDFPITPGALDTALGGILDAFVLKLDPTGSALVYSTYLGGAVPAGAPGTDQEAGRAIAVDAAGNAYVAGYTKTTDFPTTSGAYDRSFAFPKKGDPNSDAFVTKLNPTGTALVYSTYLGGAPGDTSNLEVVFGIAVDAGGNAYVAGNTNSSQFPVTAGAFDRSYNGSDDYFVTKLNPAGGALAYSTYLGGSSSDWFHALAIDASGNAHVSGSTLSTNFPTTAAAFDRTHNGQLDVSVTKLNAAGSALVYSTYLGGSQLDTSEGLALDPASGVAFVVARTASTNFPTTSGAFNPVFSGGYDVALTQLGPTGGVLYATYFGGAGQDWPEGVARSGNSVFFNGLTSSLDLPVAGSPLQPAHAGGATDSFVVRFDF